MLLFTKFCASFRKSETPLSLFQNKVLPIYRHKCFYFSFQAPDTPGEPVLMFQQPSPQPLPPTQPLPPSPPPSTHVPILPPQHCYQPMVGTLYLFSFQMLFYFTFFRVSRRIAVEKATAPWISKQ